MSETTHSLLRAALESGVEAHLPEGHGILVLIGDDGKPKVQVVDRDGAERLLSVDGDSTQEYEVFVDPYIGNPEAVRKMELEASAVREVSRRLRAECAKGLRDLLGVHEGMTPNVAPYVNRLAPAGLVALACQFKALQQGGAR
jgi:hypothetical protein